MEKASYIQNSPTQEYSNHDDEVHDTLSLSDFMIYNNNNIGDQQNFYPFDNQNLNLDIDDQFEFSSELLKTSLSNNSVVFCGKIIPYKESSVTQNTWQKKQHSQRWTFFRFFKKSSESKSNSELGKLDLKYDEVPIRKVSILASATKPRWYLLMFGFGSSSFPGEMHIRDLKKRQTSIGTKDSMQNKISSGSGGGIGSWSLVRFLGCGGGGGDSHHHPTIMKIE